MTEPIFPVEPWPGNGPERTFPLHLRFGAPPASGRSSTGWARYLARGGRVPEGATHVRYEEPGVAAFRARLEEDGSYTVDTSASVLVAEGYRHFSRLGRPVYLLWGRELGVCTAWCPCLEVQDLALLPEGVRVRSSGHFALQGAVLGFTRAVQGKRNRPIGPGASQREEAT